MTPDPFFGFKDHEGRWWSAYFSSDSTGPWVEKFGLVPLRVERLPGGDILIDVEDNPDDYQKRIMGAGRIAEALTVQGTLR